ncbi:SCY kinase-related protein (incomplete catalytic triad) [Besnoitia besnoiti]|uniref:SCY kinase-related protein (Incomplete catalytic triad) n=1 Tax=Besnoitia besnoiti TaxID=94643 RepID=A0A2A9MDW6_BESBE|nr:SCY kinase-related protein (incomplete catalytic triad) [Besnoitia besnoiti]PFH35384.1 SCY kinase-related protein (incomplete catalytic triad) [Besnoitia besnoiti]
MGNPLLKLYSVDKESAIDGGRFLRWTIYRGHQKDRVSSASSLVSLFCFDKKVLSSAPLLGSPALRSALLALLQQEAHLLQRLRHPQLLHLVQPLQEDKNSLVFCTRLVETTLREQLLDQVAPPASAGGFGGGRLGNRSYSGPEPDGTASCGGEGGLDSSPSGGRRAPLSLLEIKSGLLDLAEALQFLHVDAQLIHLNVNPDSVFFTPKGQWRLGGLGFAREVSGDGGADMLVDCGFSFGSASGSAHASVSVVPPLYYSAPELAASQPGKCCRASDIYSLGLLMAEVLLGPVPSSGARLLKTNEWDVNSHQAQCRRLLPLRPNMFASSPYFSSSSAAGSLPTLMALLSSMLNSDPSQRPTVEQFLQSPFFQDMNMRALRFLEALHEKDESQEIQFLKGFLPLLQQQEEFHHASLLRNRVLGPLLDALAFPPLYPYVLPNLCFVIKQLDDRPYFQSEVWPRVRPLLTAREIQIESVLFLMNELEYLMTQCSDEAIQQDLHPLIVKCMQIQEPRIQEAVLTRLANVYQKFDYTLLRTAVLPRVLALIQQATSSAVRIQGLAAVTAMAVAFDRSTIVEQIVSVVQQVCAADRSGVVCVAACTTLDTLAKQVGLKTTAERLLPILLPLLMEDQLTAAQFDIVHRTVTSLLSKVEATRRKQFALQLEQASAVAAALPPSTAASSFSPVFLDGGQRPGSSGLFDGSHNAGSQPLPFEALLMSPSSASGARQASQPPPPPLPPSLPPPFPPSPAPPAIPPTSASSSLCPSFASFSAAATADDPFLLVASSELGASPPLRAGSAATQSTAPAHLGPLSTAARASAPPAVSSSLLFAATRLPSDGACPLAPLPKLPEEIFGSPAGNAAPWQAAPPQRGPPVQPETGVASSSPLAPPGLTGAANDVAKDSHLGGAALQNGGRTNPCKESGSSLEDLLGASFPSPPVSREAQLRDAFADLHPPSASSSSMTALAPRVDPFANLDPPPTSSASPAVVFPPLSNGAPSAGAGGCGGGLDPFARLAGAGLGSAAPGPAVAPSSASLTNAFSQGNAFLGQVSGTSGLGSSAKVDPFANLSSLRM